MDKGGAKQYLEKIWGGEGTVHSRRVWGHAPRKFLNFRPSEIASGAYFRPFVAFK